MVPGFREAVLEATGVEPVTCPWRVYEDPVVQAALVLRRRINDGVINVSEQAAVVVDAADMITAIQSHVEAIDLRAERAKREHEQRVRDALGR